jgi:hypothetical protein
MVKFANASNTAYSRISELLNNKKVLLLLVSVILIGITVSTYLYAILAQDGVQFRGSVSYFQIAENVVTKGLYSMNGEDPTAYRAPVYPLYLAFWILLFGDNFSFPAQLFQSFFDLATGILIILISLKIFKSKLAAVISFLLYAAHFAFHLEAIAMRETVLFAFLVAVFFYIISLDRRSLLHYFSLSVIAGLLYLTRATGIFAFFFVFIDLIRFRGNSRAFLLNAAVAISAILAIILPWHLFVYRNFHTLSFTPTSVGGHTLYYGNNPDFATISPYLDIDTYVTYVRELLEENGVDYDDEIAHDQFLRKQAVSYIRENPALVIRNSMIKLFAFFSPLRTPFGSGDLVGPRGSVRVENFHFSTLTTSLISFPAVHLILIGIFIYGWHKLRTKRTTWAELLIYLFIAFVTGLHLLYPAESRFRYPIDPLLIILAGAGYASIIQKKAGGKTSWENE